jgi:hypothetical protein
MSNDSAQRSMNMGSNDAWNGRGQMGWFGWTGAHVGVWAVGPNHDGGGRGDQMAQSGGGYVHKQHRLSLGSI